jgi:hypothetical protein
MPMRNEMGDTRGLAPNVGGQRAMEAKAQYQARVAEYKIDGVCARCHDIILSKKQTGKYRPLRTPAKCAGCSQKTIFSAYNTYCNQCANSKRICCRCGDKRGEYQGSKEADDELRRLTALLDQGDLNERQRRSTTRKLEKAKEARRDAAKSAREARVMQQMASASADVAIPDSDDDEDPDEEEQDGATSATAGGEAIAAGLQSLSFSPDAPLAFNFASPAAPLGASPAASPAVEAVDVSSAAEASASEPPAAAKSYVMPELVKSPASVDAAFDAAWPALIQVVTPGHASSAEEAFDAVCEAVSDAASDKMTDGVAAAVAKVAAAGEGSSESASDDTAATALAMLREVLRWRAAVACAAEAGPPEQAAAEAAAESAARVLHQLFTMSRSWGTFNRWVGGALVQ